MGRLGGGVLGLSGRVGESDFRAVRNRLAPATRQRLSQARADRVLGFDLCFRAPRSVSSLAGVEDAPELVVGEHGAFFEDFGRGPVLATRTLRVATRLVTRDLMSSRDSPVHEAFVR